MVLDRTPFYAESGGQVGDTGLLTAGDSLFRVADTRKRQQAYVHHGKLEKGSLSVGDTVAARVDTRRRQAVMRNHSATHLMHAALRQVLGEHVSQKGSLVGPDYLRFDFSHGESVSAEQIAEIERLVNEQILANSPVTTELMDIDAARAAGAMALFGEKYDDQVRVLSMGEAAFSKELCGGTHVARTGDIGLFKVIAEGASSAGVRRIEAVAGEQALAVVRRLSDTVSRVAGLVKSAPDQVAARVEQMVGRTRELEKEIERLKQKLASGSGNDLSAQVNEIGGVKVIATQLDGADAKTLRTAVDSLKDKLGSAVVLLAAAEGDKISLVAGVTADLSGQYPAGDLVRHVASALGGKGGGRADMAQGGGSDLQALPGALAQVADWIAARQS